MTDILDLEEVSKIVGHHLSDWNGRAGILYVQSREGESMDLVGNEVLRPYLGERKVVPAHSVSTWIQTLSKSQLLSSIGTASLAMFSRLLDMAEAEQWDVQLRRVVRLGDCRAASSFGTDTEQAGAERMLETNSTTENQVALVEVAGTPALFAETNFLWESGDFYKLKSCYQFHEACTRVIPGLASKGVKRFLVAGEDLHRKLTELPLLSSYKKLFVLSEDPSVEAVALRNKVIVGVGRRGRLQQATIAPKQRWLDIARQTFAPKHSAPITEALKLHFRALKAEGSDELEEILGTANGMADASDEATKSFAKGVICLVKSKLGKLLEDHELKSLLATGAERELWWDAAVRSEALSWVRRQGSGNWLGQLGCRGAPALAQAALDSSVSYLHTQTAVRTFLPDSLLDIAPFESLELHLENSYRLTSLREALRDGASSRGAIEASLALNRNAEFKYSFLNTFSQSAFYDDIEALFWKIDRLQAAEFSNAAKQIWGESPYQRKLELRLAFAADRHEETARLGRQYTKEVPDDYGGWLMLAEACQSLHCFDEAIQSYKQMKALSPDDQYSDREIARCHSLDGDDATAIAFLESIPEPTRDQNTVQMLSRLYCYDGNYAGARESLSNLDPLTLDAWMVRFYVNIAVHLDSWDSAHALLLAHRGQLSEEFPTAVRLAALALAERGDAALAIRSLSPELRFENGWNGAVDSIAYCLSCLEREKDAAELYLRLEDPDEDTVYAWACMQYSNLNFKASFDIAEKGLARWPDSLPLLVLAGEIGDLFGGSSHALFEKASSLFQNLTPSPLSIFDKSLRNIVYSNVGNWSEAEAIVESCAEPSMVMLLYSAMTASITGQKSRLAAQYDKAIEAMHGAATPEIRSAIRNHLADIEVYGRRGLIPDWKAFRTQASDRLKKFISAPDA